MRVRIFLAIKQGIIGIVSVISSNSFTGLLSLIWTLARPRRSKFLPSSQQMKPFYPRYNQALSIFTSFF